MELPNILKERELLDLFQAGLRIPSERKESAFLLPQSQSEVGFRSGHLLKLCAFSIG